MKKFLCALVLLVGYWSGQAAAQPVSAPFVRLWHQTESGSIDADSETGAELTEAQGLSTIGLQVTGTFVGTLELQCSENGSTYQALRITPSNSTTAVTSLTGTGLWFAPAACVKVRVRSTAWTSGTAMVTLFGSPAGGGASGGGSSGGGTEFLEDAAHTSGDSGSLALAVRRDANTTLVDTTGDYGPLQLDANGNLKVNIIAGAGSGGTAAADDSAFTLATTNVTVAGCVEATDSMDAGDLGGIKCGADRELDIDVISMPADATELPAAAALADNTANPTVPGVAAFMLCWDGSTWDRCAISLITEATHDGALTVGTTVSTVGMFRASAAEPTNVSAGDDAVLGWALLSGAQVHTMVDFTGDSAMDNTNDALRVNIVAGGAAGGTSMTDDAAFTVGTTVFTPIGGTYKSTRDSLDDNDGGAAALNIKRGVYVSPETPLGDSIADDTLDTLKVSQATAANLNATVVGTGTFAVQVSSLPASTNTIEVVGDAAHDAAFAGNPLAVGGYASAAAPADVSADGDAVRAWFLRSGALAIQPTFGGTLAAVNNGSVSAGTLRVTIADDSTGIVGLTGAALTSLQLLDDAIKTDDVNFSVSNDEVMMAGFYADDDPVFDSLNAGDGGAARMSLDRILFQRPGGALVHYRTATGLTEDEHQISASPGTLFSILVTNTNAAARYLRCYNLTAASTTPGTSTVLFGAAIPGQTTGAGFSIPFPSGLTFDTALTCTFTTGAADTDVAEVAADEIKAIYTYR